MGKFLKYMLAGTLSAISISSTISFASELRLLEADQLYFETAKTWHLIDPYWDRVRYDYDEFGNKLGDSGEYWTYGMCVGFDLTLVQAGDFAWTWTNRVEGNSTNYQFRRVAWGNTMEMKYGKVSAFASHLSEHLLDADYPGMYPLTDFYGVRLYFLGGE